MRKRCYEKKEKPKFDIEISTSPFPFVTIIRYMNVWWCGLSSLFHWVLVRFRDFVSELLGEKGQKISSKKKVKRSKERSLCLIEVGFCNFGWLL